MGMPFGASSLKKDLSSCQYATRFPHAWTCSMPIWARHTHGLRPETSAWSPGQAPVPHFPVSAAVLPLVSLAFLARHASRRDGYGERLRKGSHLLYTATWHVGSLFCVGMSPARDTYAGAHRAPHATHARHTADWSARACTPGCEPFGEAPCASEARRLSGMVVTLTMPAPILALMRCHTASWASASGAHG